MKISCPYCQAEDNYYDTNCKQCGKELRGDDYFGTIILRYGNIISKLDDKEYQQELKDTLFKNIDSSTHLQDEYYNTFYSIASIWFKELKSVLVSVPYIQVSNPNLRNYLVKINNSDSTDIHSKFKNVSHHLTQDDEEFIQEEIAIYDIFQAMVEVGTLIVEYPPCKHISHYIYELRKTYALRLYTSSIIMCRAIIELCIKDRLVEAKLYSYDDINKDRKTLSYLSDVCLRFGIINDPIRDEIS